MRGEEATQGGPGQVRCRMAVQELLAENELSRVGAVSDHLPRVTTNNISPATLSRNLTIKAGERRYVVCATPRAVQVNPLTVHASGTYLRTLKHLCRQQRVIENGFK